MHACVHAHMSVHEFLCVSVFARECVCMRLDKTRTALVGALHHLSPLGVEFLA